MTTIEVFNVCTHAEPESTGMVGRPTAAVVAFHPFDNNRFVTGGGDFNVIMWRLASRSEIESGLEQLCRLTFHTRQVNALEWSPCGSIVASGSDDGFVALWKRDNEYIPTQAFGQDMTFQEKWKLKERLKEDHCRDIVDLQWTIDKYNKNGVLLFCASINGYIFIYHIKDKLSKNKNKNNQRSDDIECKLIHSIGIQRNSFVQGIAIDNIYSSLVAVQSTDRSCRVFKRKLKIPKKQIDLKNFKFKFTYEKYVNITYYPLASAAGGGGGGGAIGNNSNKTTKTSKDSKDKSKNSNNDNSVNKNDDSKSMDIDETENTASNNDNNNNDNKKEGKSSKSEKENNNNNNNNSNNNNGNTKKDEKTPKTEVKEKKCSLYSSNVVTTCKRPDWSPDSLFLATVAGQPKPSTNSNNSNNNSNGTMSVIHICHRSDLQNKITSFYCKNSNHIMSCKWNPNIYSIDNNGIIEKNSICDKYKINYQMLLAAVSDCEVFIFDTLKSKYPIFYWRDNDCRGFHDLSWNANGNGLIISDVESFLTFIQFSDDDIKPQSIMTAKNQENDTMSVDNNSATPRQASQSQSQSQQSQIQKQQSNDTTTATTPVVNTLVPRRKK